MLLGPGAAHAAAPANDAFASAAPLAVGEQVSGSNVDATVETGEPDPTGFAASDTCPDIATGVNCGTSVWYTFQPASSGQYTIGICDGGTDVYGIVGVYTGALGSLTQVGASGQGQQCASLGNNLAGTQAHLRGDGRDGLPRRRHRARGSAGLLLPEGLPRTGDSTDLARHRGGPARLLRRTR